MIMIRAQAREIMVAWCLDFYDTDKVAQLGGTAAVCRLLEDHRRPPGRSIMGTFLDSREAHSGILKTRLPNATTALPVRATAITSRNSIGYTALA